MQRFIIAILLAMTFLFPQVGEVDAKQPVKHAQVLKKYVGKKHIVKQVKKRKPRVAKNVRVSSQEWCLGDIIQGENNTSETGRVAAGVSALNRAYSGDWGRIGDVCAVRIPSQFHYLKEPGRQNPGPAAMEVARRLLADVKSGRPTIQPELQLQLAGVESFHDRRYKPSRQWNKHNKFVLKIAGQSFYKPRKGKIVSLYASVTPRTPQLAAKAKVAVTKPVLLSFNK